MLHLFLISCLVSFSCGSTFHLSFIHSVQDGPNADVYVNNQPLWQDVAHGTVIPYAAVSVFEYYYEDNVQIPVVMVDVYISGTQTPYLHSSISGLMFNNITTWQSGYVVLYGGYNAPKNATASHLMMRGFFNYGAITTNSSLTAFRSIFAGPTSGTHIRVTLQRLYYGSYLLCLDYRVEQLGTAFYSTLSAGEYLVNILDDVTGDKPLYESNITLASGNYYSIVVMGNMTVTNVTAPITAQLIEDHTNPSPPICFDCEPGIEQQTNYSPFFFVAFLVVLFLPVVGWNLVKWVRNRRAQEEEIRLKSQEIGTVYIDESGSGEL